MVRNPAGYVCIADGANPRIITGKAISGILPGMIVTWSGANNAVSSGVNSFSSDDLWVDATASGASAGGVAIGSAASGNYVAVATRGLVILTVGTTVTAGQNVTCEGDHCLKGAVTAGQVIGRALTNAGSEGYALVSLNNL